MCAALRRNGRTSHGASVIAWEAAQRQACKPYVSSLQPYVPSLQPYVARPLDLGKLRSLVGNSPCDPRAIERRTASLDGYLRQVRSQ